MRLKVEYRADLADEKVEWNPKDFHVFLDDMELDMVAELNLTIMGDGTPPVAFLTFTPDEIDIDEESILALRALLENAEDSEETEEEEA